MLDAINIINTPAQFFAVAAFGVLCFVLGILVGKGQ